MEEIVTTGFVPWCFWTDEHVRVVPIRRAFRPHGPSYKSSFERSRDQSSASGASQGGMVRRTACAHVGM
jgi:hypothetical protein